MSISSHTLRPADRVRVVGDQSTRDGIALPFNNLVKRVIDVIGATVALLVLAPLFLAVALLVKIGDPTGPVFYKQKRVGRAGRAIEVIKFRSMKWEYSTGPGRPYQTAVEAFRAMDRPDLCAEFELEYKVADDPRVTALGHFLRRTSLDELPQLVNAFLGHLSLVGPRPILAPELERYGIHGASYLSVRPGITGLWQISGRNETGYDERVRLDVLYINTWQLALDLTIMVKTVRTVIDRTGAY